MSQRLIRPGLEAVMFRGRSLHPFTLPSGRVVWPIAGGAEDDDGGGDDGTGDDDDSDATDDDAADDDSADDDAKDKKKSKDDDDDEETVPKYKYDKLHARMTAADKRSSDLQKALDDLKGKKDINAEVKAEIDELKPKAERLAKENNDLKIRLAFFSVNTVDWQDVDAALRLLDTSDIDLDDKGNVDKRAMKAAIKQLAKEKAYLVKPATKDDDAGDGTGTTKMNGNRKGSRGTATKDELAKRFPVLNR